MLEENTLQKSISVLDTIAAKRAQRLLQISMVTLSGLLAAMVFASGATQPILFSGIIGLLFSSWFAWRKQTFKAAVILLSVLMLVLSVLVWVSGGIHDLAMLGYPGLLFMAALLGNATLFLGLLLLIVLYCSVLVVLTVQGSFVMVFPDVTYAHAVFISVIFLVTGFIVYMLALDLHRLMASLRAENARVKEREHTILQLANQDQLTQLPNRRFAEASFLERLNTSVQHQQTLAVFFLDLDNFKPVNDYLGHAAGDQLLRELAQRLQSICESQDTLCRFGGDEFLLFKHLQETDEPLRQQVLEDTAQALLSTALEPFYIMENTIEISGSVGIAMAPTHGQTFAEVCRAADIAMYHAKSKGRNTYSLYHEELNRIKVDQFQLLRRLRQAIHTQELQVWYQPKVCLKTQRVLGAEALLRWPQADGSFIPPDVFIPLAESSGMIVELGEAVLRQACADCRLWQQQGFAGLKVAVNVSNVQFRNGTFPQRVVQILEEAGLAPEHLELEITESLLLVDEQDVLQQLQRLHATGIELFIDDFGTGYSNLSYLNRFNASCLKIDKSFVTHLASSQQDRVLVKAMLQMAQSLGLKIVAEGVEDQACLDVLLEMNCDYGQGYFWAAAMPLERWLVYLATRNV